MHDPKATASALVAAGKGILAADESNGTITKRFERLGIDSTPETRRDYREMLFTTPDLADHTSGVILYDETFHQATSEGRAFPGLLEDLGIRGHSPSPSVGPSRTTPWLPGAARTPNRGRPPSVPASGVTVPPSQCPADAGPIRGCL